MKDQGVLYNHTARLRNALMAYARYNIVPLPKASRERASVTIDGRHYASFVDLDHARAAVLAWRQHWPAIENKRVMAWSATGVCFEMLDD